MGSKRIALRIFHISSPISMKFGTKDLLVTLPQAQEHEWLSMRYVTDYNIQLLHQPLHIYKIYKIYTLKR